MRAALATVLVFTAVVQVSNGKWIPSGPWQWPSQQCTREYSAWLITYQQADLIGCTTTTPSNSRFLGTEMDQDSCAQACFNSLFLPASNHSAVVPLGTLNVTAVYNMSSGDCLCSLLSDTQVFPASGNKQCPSDAYMLLNLPTGCLFEDPQACIDAEGCLYTTRHCCMDASGYEWPFFQNLVPWWAWGLGAVLLLISSLLGLMVRARTRFQEGYEATLSNEENLDVDKLLEEYDVLLKELVEADKDATEEGREVGGPEEVRVVSTVNRGAEEEEEEEEAEDCDELVRLLPPRALPPPPSTSPPPPSTPPPFVSQGGTCPVCLEELEGATCVLLKCGHRLRYHCMQQYVVHSVTRGKIPACPICRAPVLTPSRSEEIDV